MFYSRPNTKSKKHFFQITNPAGVSLSTSMNSVNVTQRSVQVAIINDVPAQVFHNDSFDITVELQNTNGQTLPDVGYKVRNLLCIMLQKSLIMSL